MLIILAGLPGAGKTTIARALATRLGAVHVRVDTIEQAIRASGVPGDEIGAAGYMVAYGVGADNLSLGRTVIADSVNPVAASRDGWRSVAERCGSAFAEIEIVCRDRAEHRRRIETRASDVEGLVKPNWADVEARDIEPWDRVHIVIDTAGSEVSVLVDGLVETLGLEPLS